MQGKIIKNKIEAIFYFIEQPRLRRIQGEGQGTRVIKTQRQRTKERAKEYSVRGLSLIHI